MAKKSVQNQNDYGDAGRVLIDQIRKEREKVGSLQKKDGEEILTTLNKKNRKKYLQRLAKKSIKKAIITSLLPLLPGCLVFLCITCALLTFVYIIQSAISNPINNVNILTSCASAGFGGDLNNCVENSFGSLGNRIRRD